MSGDSQKLLELAKRCEKAEGPDRELDNAIALEVFEFLRNLPRSAEGGWLHPAHGRICPAAEYTASLDSALTLVPKKAMWSICDMEAGPFAQVIRPTGDGGYLNGLTSASGESPALALVAAALRARAAI